MAEELRNYKVDVEIDNNNLENEVIEQPSLYLIYSELFVEYTYQRDLEKSKLDQIEAELDLKIRQNPENYGFEGKTTEAAIKHTIILEKSYQDLLKSLHNLNKKVNTYSGMKTAFEHRKKSLDNLVSLKIGGFHSGLKVTTKNELNKQIHNEQKEELNKNPRLLKIKSRSQK